MAPEVPALLGLMRDSVATPQAAAARLLALRPPPGVVLQGAVLISALDALLLGLLTGGTGVELSIPGGGEVTLSPFAHAAMLLGSLLASSVTLHVGGRMLGGQGRLQDALLVVVWLEVLAIGVELVLLVAAALLAPVAPLLGLAGVALLLWCVVHFTRALHGFQGLGRTVLALILGALVVGLALSIVLALLGFGVSPDV